MYKYITYSRKLVWKLKKIFVRLFNYTKTKSKILLHVFYNVYSTQYLTNSNLPITHYITTNHHLNYFIVKVSLQMCK